VPIKSHVLNLSPHTEDPNIQYFQYVLTDDEMSAIIRYEVKVGLGHISLNLTVSMITEIANLWSDGRKFFPRIELRAIPCRSVQ
jgi:hypothetical protein